MKNSTKNGWSLTLLLLAGIVLGGFIGWVARDVDYLAWLNYGQNFGFDKPILLNLGIMRITFGFSIKITMSSLIGLLIAIFVYKKI